jgi:hypothetical protein
MHALYFVCMWKFNQSKTVHSLLDGILKRACVCVDGIENGIDGWMGKAKKQVVFLGNIIAPNISTNIRFEQKKCPFSSAAFIQFEVENTMKSNHTAITPTSNASILLS